MVRHIVAWNFADGFSDAENAENAVLIKQQLQELAALIDGIIEIKVYIEPMPDSNRAVVLSSLFESVEAFNAYKTHPEHVRVGKLVRASTKDRVCFDSFE